MSEGDKKLPAELCESAENVKCVTCDSLPSPISRSRVPLQPQVVGILLGMSHQHVEQDDDYDETDRLNPGNGDASTPHPELVFSIIILPGRTSSPLLCLVLCFVLL
jgi:hypothetical protein